MFGINYIQDNGLMVVDGQNVGWNIFKLGHDGCWYYIKMSTIYLLINNIIM